MELGTFLSIASIWCTDAMIQEIWTYGRVFKSAVCTRLPVFALEFEVVFADRCRYRGWIIGVVADSDGLVCDQ